MVAASLALYTQNKHKQSLHSANLAVTHAQVQLGFVSGARRHELRAVANAVPPAARLGKVYAVLAQLGFASIAGLDARDAATLTLVEKYVKFRQGEVWLDIATAFHARGFEPTAADAERLAGGAEFSERLAAVVVADQRRLLGAAEADAAAVEAAGYAATLAQAALEREAKFYKKDRSQVRPACRVWAL